MPPALIPRSETQPVQRCYSPRLPRLPFFYFWRVYNVHIYISTYANVQEISCPYIPAFPCPQPQRDGVPRLRLDTWRIPGEGTHRRSSQPRLLLE
jgi:hypothetical protein